MLWVIGSPTNQEPFIGTNHAWRTMQEEAKLSGPLGPEERCWRCEGVYVQSTLRTVYHRAYTAGKTKWVPVGKICEPCLRGDVHIVKAERGLPGPAIEVSEIRRSA